MADGRTHEPRGGLTPWQEARQQITAALVSTGSPAFFARLGEIDGELAEIDRLSVGDTAATSAADVVEFACGGRGRVPFRLTRIDDEAGPVGVLAARARSAAPAPRIVDQITRAARSLEALVPAAPAHVLLENQRIVFGCASSARWTSWPGWASITELLPHPRPEPLVCAGAVVRSTAMTDRGRSAYLLHLARANRPELSPLSVLTPTQRKVVAFAAVGATLPEVARSMDLSIETIRSHLREAYRRLGIASRAELAALVARTTDSSPRS